LKPPVVCSPILVESLDEPETSLVDSAIRVGELLSGPNLELSRVEPQNEESVVEEPPLGEILTEDSVGEADSLGEHCEVANDAGDRAGGKRGDERDRLVAAGTDLIGRGRPSPAKS
jgi:hypothetical protein